VTFYLDADIPAAVRRAIATCRQDVLYAGGPHAPAVDTKDPVWLEHAGREGWVTISRDKHIRRKPAERRAAMQHGVKLFVLTAGGNLTRWDTLDLLVRRWSDIGEVARQPGPFVCAITRGGLRMIDPPAISS
jgi:hypothetical protein